MPVYESHLGAPDYAGTGARYRPVDIPGSVERGMRLAAEMTAADIEAQGARQELAMRQALAPHQIEQAKIQVELLDQQRRVGELVNAPERLRRKLDAEDAQMRAQTAAADLQVQQLQDEAEFIELDKAGQLDRLVFASKNSLAEYLAERSAILRSGAGRNSKMKATIRQLDSEVAATDWVVTDENGAPHTEKGARLMGVYQSDRSAFEKLSPSFGNQAQQTAARTMDAMDRDAMILSTRTGIKLSDAKGIISAGYRAAGIAVTNAMPTVEKILAQQKAIGAQRDVPEIAEPENVRAFGNVGGSSLLPDDDIHDFMRQYLEDQIAAATQIDNEIRTSPGSRGKLRRADVAAVKARAVALRSMIGAGWTLPSGQAFLGPRGGYETFFGSNKEALAKYLDFRRRFTVARKEGWKSETFEPLYRDFQAWLGTFVVDQGDLAIQQQLALGGYSYGKSTDFLNQVNSIIGGGLSATPERDMLSD